MTIPFFFRGSEFPVGEIEDREVSLLDSASTIEAFGEINSEPERKGHSLI